MPRQASEAAAHLEMYKLLVEKKRLQQELETIEQRQRQILERLTVLQTEVTELEQSAQALGGSTNKVPPHAKSAPRGSSQPANQEEFNTLLLEY